MLFFEKQASKTFEPESPSEGFVSYKDWIENKFANAYGVIYYNKKASWNSKGQPDFCLLVQIDFKVFVLITVLLEYLLPRDD